MQEIDKLRALLRAAGYPEATEGADFVIDAGSFPGRIVGRFRPHDKVRMLEVTFGDMHAVAPANLKDAFVTQEMIDEDDLGSQPKQRTVEVTDQMIDAAERVLDGYGRLISPTSTSRRKQIEEMLSAALQFKR